MAVLNLRNVPEDLKRRLAVQAASAGKRLHAYCVELLDRAAADGPGTARRLDRAAADGLGTARRLDRLLRWQEMHTAARGDLASDIAPFKSPVLEPKEPRQNAGYYPAGLAPGPEVSEADPDAEQAELRRLAEDERRREAEANLPAEIRIGL